MKALRALKIVLMCVVAPFAVASQPVQLHGELNGYTRVVIDANYEQKNPLQKVVSLELPSSIQNVGQGINFVIYSTGYRLADLDAVSPEVLELLTLPVPLVNTTFVQVTVEQVIDVLIGHGFAIEVSDARRVITVVKKV
ncbi:hypothetical protein A6E01_19355 (plasmid) [Vibrio breoganii]|uniref:Uncharacterized protein n=1 Tax=Vibrio breoganii TaxID=553239 RepID=A0AAN1CU64_9VIBR|nr:hypothetical protein [Vibrio breoganii]ANO35373.1 hypothetical protein A6E01_19355 [Vibrio breoganii]